MGDETQPLVKKWKMPSVVQEKHLNKMLPLQTFHYEQDQEFSDIAIRHPELGKQVTSEVQDNYNPNDQLLDMIESDDEIRPSTHTSAGRRKKLTTPNVQDQVKPSSSSQYVQLLNSKQALVTHRYLKYNALYSRLLQFDLRVTLGKKKKLRPRVLVVLFCLQLVGATQESLLNYHKQSLTHYRQFYPIMNEECLQFVNLSLIKSIIYKPNRVQMMQKLEKKSLPQRILQIQCSAEIVKEIFQKLNLLHCSSRLFKFLKCISTQGYFPLNQFHSPFVSDHLNYSHYFGYLDFSKKKDKKLPRKLIIAEMILIKNIIFYGLLFKTQELFKQFNIQFDIIYMIIFILLHSVLEEDFLNLNLKDLVNLKFDGQFVFENMNEINKAKSDLWEEIIKENNVNIDLLSIKNEAQKWFQ